MNRIPLLKLYSKKSTYLLISFFIGYVSFGQMSSGEDEIQYLLSKLLSSFYPTAKKPMKSFLYIINKDTISKSNYDKNGNEYAKVDYEKNKPFYKSLSKYNGNLKTETTFFMNNILQSTTTYTYDARKNLIEWKVIKTVYDKKTQSTSLIEDLHWFIEFNANNRMKRRFSVDAAHAKMLSYEYTYDVSNKLVEIDEVQWKNTYEYKGDVVVNMYRIFKNDGSVYASSEFKYNEANRLIESSDKNYTSEYTYDSENLKKYIRTKKQDKTYQEIDFIYSNNLLSKVEIKATDSNMRAEFIFELDYLYGSWKKNEVNNLKMEFVYDKYNNIIEIKYFIKDVYKYSKLFIYTYYH